MFLETKVEKNKISSYGSISRVEVEDISTLEKVFCGLEFECFQDDGIPTFTHGENRLHLVRFDTLDANSYAI